MRMVLRQQSRLLTALAFWLSVALISGGGFADEPEVTESWMIVSLRGQRVGHTQTREWKTVNNGQTQQISEINLRTVIKRFDEVLTVILEQRTEEDADGALRRFRLCIDNPPSSRTELTGEVEETTLRLTTVSGGQSSESRLTVPKGVKASTWVDRVLTSDPPPVGESQKFSMFDPQVGTIVDVKVTNRGPAKFTPPDAEEQTGNHSTMEYLTVIPGVVVDCYTAADGKILMFDSAALGTRIWKVTKEQALEESAAEMDFGQETLIKVTRIPNASSTKRVDYRVHLPAGLSDGLLPESNTQSVTRIDPETVTVAVRSLRPAAAGKATGDATGDAAAKSPGMDYLAATPLARSDDPEIVKLANSTVTSEMTPVEAAIALEKKVHAWLSQKNMSNNLASASEVVRSREGDCTEHSVLLTALLRARKIPARMVVGIVYVDQFSAFAGHAWTEAWINGEWVPLDATEASGGIAATHIRLSDSSLVDGDAGFLSGAISTWRLMDQARIEVLQIESDK